MPGESTGGNLAINTKTFPDDRQFGLSIQGGYTSGLTGETAFVDPLQGDFDSLGWDDGTRAQDSALAVISEFLSSGEAIDMTPKEFALLAFLMRSPGRVLTRTQILEGVWGWLQKAERKRREREEKYGKQPSPEEINDDNADDCATIIVGWSLTLVGNDALVLDFSVSD